MKLSKNFTYEELLVTDYRHLQYENYTVVPKLVAHTAEMLVYGFMEQLRDDYNKPIRVNSFIRSEELNNFVGGTKNSQHLDGSAVDIMPWDGDRADLIRLFALASKLPYRQLILYPAKGFIHLSINSPGYDLKHEILIRE